KIIVPETGIPETLGSLPSETSARDVNLVNAVARGTLEGLHLSMNIGAMLIAFIGLITLLDKGLGACGTSLQAILGSALAPIAYLLGVPWADCRIVGSLLGTRVVVNELVAFNDLAESRPILMPRSFTIATFALCGFANLGSIGIQIGGIGALA